MIDMKNTKKSVVPILPALAVMLSMLFLAACARVEDGAAAQSGAGESAVSGSVEAASADADASAADDAFSKRDLSGEYDTEDAVVITLNGAEVSVSSSGAAVSGSDVTISEAGTYIISGTLENGSLIVDAGDEDKVQLVLSDADISSDSYAAIYVKNADKVFVTLAENTVNRLSNGGSFVQRDSNNVDGVIFAKDDLTLNGSGSLTVVSPAGHGIVCKDELVIAGGSYTVTAGSHGIQAKDSVAISGSSITIDAGKDGVHSENDDDDTLGTAYIAGGSIAIKAADDGIHATSLLRIDGGELEITAAEGLEATYVLINDGTVTITASDDGVNAARKSTAYTPTVEINGGSITISMGQGDTDGIDSNGNLVITGGTINVTGSSAFDYEGTVTWTGGTVIVNGQEQTQIANQMMGGGFGGGGFGGGRGGGFGGGGRRP